MLLSFKVSCLHSTGHCSQKTLTQQNRIVDRFRFTPDQEFGF